MFGQRCLCIGYSARINSGVLNGLREILFTIRDILFDLCLCKQEADADVERGNRIVRGRFFKKQKFHLIFVFVFFLFVFFTYSPVRLSVLL